MRGTIDFPDMPIKRNLGRAMRYADEPRIMPVNDAYQRRLEVVIDALRAGADKELMRTEHGSVIIKEALERLAKDRYFVAGN